MRTPCGVPSAVGAAVMPDAHAGYGLPIGGVLACDNAVIPYAVGVDIACRMKLSVLDMPVETLTEELGPDGINVTVVHPGLTRTEATPARIAELARSAAVTEAEAETRMAAGNSVRRIIESEDIAAIVAFLASPKSVAINGDTIAAGGGVGRAIHY